MSRQSNWPITTIGKSSYLRGRIGWQGLRAAEFKEGGPYLVTGTDFVGGKINWDTCYHVSEERYAEAAYIHIRDSDVLVTKDGTIGKIALVENCPEKTVLNSGIFLLRCKDGSYNHSFIGHILQSQIFQKFLDDNLAGSTIQHLYQYIFEGFEFPVPNPCEQTKIAEILSTVDQAIEQTETLIAKQQRIKTGLMQDLLTRGIDEHGNLRSEDTHEFKDSPLGRIPVEWESGYFQSCISGSPKNGIYKPQSAYGEQGTPIVRIDGFSHGDRIKAQSYRRIRLSKPEIEQFSLGYGDILINRVNSIQYLGKTALVEHPPEVTVFESNMMRLTIDPQRMLPEFALLILTSSATSEHFLSSAKLAIAQASINQNDVNSLRVQLPHLEEQHAICERMVSIDDSIRDTLLSLKKLRQIKVALMQDLLTGKVSVSPLLTDAESDT